MPGSYASKGFTGILAPSSWGISVLRLDTPWRRRQAVQAGARDLGVDELAGHRQQVIQGQQEGLTQRHHRFLGRAERGVEPLGRCEASSTPSRWRHFATV